MAPAISTLKKQSHPFFTRSPFDVSSPKNPVIAPGSTYGQLPADSGVTFNDSATGQEISMKVQLFGYGSASMALIRDHTYLLSGCLISPNLKTPPVLYYDQDLTFPMGPTANLPISLSNKTAVWGFGLVISKNERDDTSGGQSAFRSLFVVMKHTDYDNQSKNQVSFNVSYKIPGNRNLAKTFGLFQPGREMLLSGTLTGYDKTQRMLQVQPPTDQTHNNTRKHYQISFDSDDDGEPEAAANGICSSVQATVPPGSDKTDAVTELHLPEPHPKRKYTRKRKNIAPDTPVLDSA
ncbi:hypothetical protein PGT21_017182 [Puccinia graminis f. sp. tritici]|uniref:Uncharacterized protein n=1 Tax=Puccinia graminis f. sp. tritici TaxID=56615 RepID=A0A5B0QXI0_PUCGR|nr:hypothetical protein PGT21_017182 [Puccinia graminis f. sp. tritici]